MRSWEHADSFAHAQKQACYLLETTIPPSREEEEGETKARLAATTAGVKGLTSGHKQQRYMGIQPRKEAE